MDKKDLSLCALAIGSLPHSVTSEAMELVKDCFSTIPFFPQLANVQKNEDMVFQILERMAGVVHTPEKFYISSESEDFFMGLEELFMDYEECIADSSSPTLDKYSISKDYSSSFKPFLDIVKEEKPKFAKGQIIGPFTLATSMNDQEGRCAFYDETLREVIVKTLILKALWQIKKIKDANPNTTPIIFMDEPSISQLGTSAFITVSQEDVISILKEVSDVIRENGGLSAIHCCGKCDWTIPIKAGVNILNLDAFMYAENLSLFADDVKDFINNGGYITWGVVPTLDVKALSEITLEVAIEKFENAINLLVKKGLDEKKLLAQSLVSTSCGAGGLSVELAKKAMTLTKELSKSLKEKYIDC